MFRQKLDQLLKIDTDDALELRYRGAEYLMLGQYENALTHLSKLEYGPNNAVTLRLLADVYYMLNQHDIALRNLNKLCRLIPATQLHWR